MHAEMGLNDCTIAWNYANWADILRYDLLPGKEETMVNFIWDMLELYACKKNIYISIYTLNILTIN